MLRKCLYLLLIGVLLVGTISACTPNAVTQSQTQSNKTIAIGTIPSTSRHMIAPREEVVINLLTANGEITKDTSKEGVQQAVAAYYKKFDKGSRTWASPETQLKAEQRERDLAAGTLSTQAIQPVVANVFVLPVDFKDVNETITPAAPCTSFVAKGPQQGTMPQPPATDNNTVWYSPAQTASSSFYANLIFGYVGVPTRVRTNLTGPDGKAGFDLSGYTVQDYYDHVAGKGNVALQGTVAEWTEVAHSEAYYGAPRCDGADNDGGMKKVGQLVPDALAKYMAAHPALYTQTGADAFWPKYDANHDNYVDAFWIIHAGEGEEAGGGSQGENAIWSHSWAISAQGIAPVKVYEGNPAITTDNIYVDPYTMQPETATVGVMSEEFGHNFFGWPDLYTNDSGNSIAFWDHLSAGSWGGPLGGAVPTGMPLWFKMIAQCGAGFCNWQEPMTTREYDAPSADVTIAQIEQQVTAPTTPTDVSKGVRVNLPPTTKNVANLSGGTGKAAYSGTGIDNAYFTLDRQITVPASGTNELTVQSYWFIEDCGDVLCDLGAVTVTDGAQVTYLSDSNFSTLFDHPYLIGEAPAATNTLHFNLAPFAGKTVTLSFIYVTDGGYTEPGWWIDNLALDGTSIDAFETSTAPSTFAAGWTNDGWQVVPNQQLFPQYYLVEWRNGTKYDSSVKTAYLTRSNDAGGWNVSRIPYNIPGALLYYRNTYQPDRGYYLVPNGNMAFWDGPSVGPKLKLLVVDMNYGPVRFETTSSIYTLNNVVGSYDSALTLQGTEAFTLDKLNTSTGPVTGTNNYPSKPPVISFNDFYGYYAGRYTGAPCAAASGYCTMNTAGSAVIPASGDYSVRITDFNGTPRTDLYGVEDPGWIWPLGSGNPGDEGVEYGVKFSLIGKTQDGTQATLRFGLDAPTLYTSDIEGPYFLGHTRIFHATMTNPTAKAYSKALFRYTIKNINLADIGSFEYKAGDSWLPMPMAQSGADVVGYYGPASGFPLPANYVAETTFRVNFLTRGTYDVNLKLVDLNNSEAVLDTLDAQIKFGYLVNLPMLRR